jgi:Carboxypeptidase regulatory-like domain
MKNFALFLSLMLILTCAAFGQTSSSSQSGGSGVVLTGTVYDTNHAVIVSSEIVARSSGGKEYQATTNTEGVYKIQLPVDVYKIEANAPGFCPKRVDLFTVRKSSLAVERLSKPTMPVLQRPLDFVLEVPPSDTPGLLGYRPCKQETMIKKEPPTRHPELFRSIAE